MSTSTERPVRSGTAGDGWWSHRRFGLLLHLSVDAVPSWAPVGRPADDYRTDHFGYIDGGEALVETIAHHRDRWHHVNEHDDFIELLTFDEFDADAWAGLARDTGVGLLIVTARDRDGLCWFDTAGTDRDVTTVGPRRDVIGDLAAACERADLVLGAQYSGGSRNDESHVSALVADYGVRRLTAPRSRCGRTDPDRSLRAVVERARLIDPGLVVDDRIVPDDAVRTFDRRPPSTPVDEPWELMTSFGAGPSFNRAERDEHLATPARIVADLTEAIAKGGHLLLGIGVDAQGRIPSAHADRCRAVGGWVRRHRDLVDRGQPWELWGDADCRYLRLDDVVHAIDVSGRGRFGDLTPGVGRVMRVETLDGTPISFEQDHRGVSLDRPSRRAQRLAQVYRLTIGTRPDAAARLFEEPPTPPVDLASLVDGATRGTIVQLGDEPYTGPASVPAGVTLRGLGADRTRIVVRPGSAVQLLAGARLEHCAVVSSGPDTGPPCTLVRAAGDGAVVLGCSIGGSVEVAASHVRLVSITVRSVRSRDVDHLAVVRSTIIDPTGDPVHDPVGVAIAGGAGHLVDSCRIGACSTGVVIDGSIGSVVRGNRCGSRWTGVHLVAAHDTAVLANSFERVTRSVDIAGGSGAEISGNVATAGDSGVVIRDGATNCTVAGNRWERTRIGILIWGAGDVRHHDNDAIDLGDGSGAVVTGP